MIRKLISLYREVFIDPMPLEEFSDYDDYWDQRVRQEPKYRFVWVADRLPEQGRLLDVGCGDGAFLEHARQVRPDLGTVGIDGSATAIEKLKEKGLEGAVVGDLDRPDLSGFRDVDVVVAMEIIEHLAEPERLMEEIRKTEARTVYITIPNLGFILNRLRLALGGKMPVTAIVYHIKEHLRHWTVRDFRHWADHCGFTVEHYVGQNGFFGLWRIWPSLFARQMIYVLSPKAR
ncbi:class I SAM-dependent methyltransferase [Haloferula sp. A504]|uniref:class I SAM-dependent methyltransferase n=1 Tax=Haloferula sp. A504 TaxID=3373601 RepID=UPI0031C247BD|nr:methionine biosynthesis protein MetW [Verrucomicrobiaceae bacterium E54]